MPAEAYREAIAKFDAVKAELLAAADSLSRLADCLREHPMRVKCTSTDLQTACELKQLLARFAEARDTARSAFLNVPTDARGSLNPPP